MSELKLIKTQKFGIIECDIYGRDEEFFMTREQIGRALEYKNPQKAIDNIHAKYKDRLDGFSVTLKTRGTDNKIYDTTLYSRKGIMEVCRYSRQPKADKFMDWAWGVLDSLISGKATLSQKVYETKATSLGEVASYTKEMDRRMEKQGSSPWMICQAFKMVSEQFGIVLPDDFVKVPEYEQVKLSDFIKGE